MSTRGVEVRGGRGERLSVGWRVTVLGVSSIESAVSRAGEGGERHEGVSMVAYARGNTTYEQGRRIPFQALASLS